MKTSLEHLPEGKQHELQAVTETIVSMVNPEMIILFGSYSRGDWVEDRYHENGTLYEYKSDYDILVVTEASQNTYSKLEKEIRHKVKKALLLQTTPHIIFHDINFLNAELEDGHYFFADIVKEGTMLYDSEKFTLATPRILSPKDRAKKAQLYFDNWLESADMFFEDYESNSAKGQKNARYFKNAIFNLHQAAEKYLYTILLVFTDYKPKTHELDALMKQASYTDIRFKIIFPNQTEEEKRLFTLLVKAYIDSRYKLGYTVNPDDLKWLAGRVQLLKELTKSICEEKIAEFGKG